MDVSSQKVPKKVKIGLVSFSTGPDVLVVPTTDRGRAAGGVDLLSPEAGTAIGDGLGVAVQVVKHVGGAARREVRTASCPAAIVLLSDGAQTRGVLTPLQGAALARKAGIRVYTIALGTNHGTLGFGPFGGYGFGGGFGNGSGRRFPVRPDPVTLAAIAQATDGQTYRAKTADEVDSIYKHARLEHRAPQRQARGVVVVRGAAALLLLGALGSRG